MRQTNTLSGIIPALQQLTTQMEGVRQTTRNESGAVHFPMFPLTYAEGEIERAQAIVKQIEDTYGFVQQADVDAHFKKMKGAMDAVGQSTPTLVVLDSLGFLNDQPKD